MQTYATSQRKKADLQKQIASKVFDVSMDAQEGACYSVLDEMADQYIKEQLLAYFLLRKHRYPATEVRARCAQTCSLCGIIQICRCHFFGVEVRALVVRLGHVGADWKWHACSKYPRVFTDLAALAPCRMSSTRSATAGALMPLNPNH